MSFNLKNIFVLSKIGFSFFSSGLKLKTQVFPGGTDSRYVRKIGLPAIGFSPINKTPILLHDNDEYLGRQTFLKGIDIYCAILAKVANVEERTG